MTDNAETIRNFIAAWSRLDADELTAFFHVDGVYHNMPAEPVAGHEALRGFIAGFIKDWSSTRWEILNLVADGDLVIVERLDRTVAGGRNIDLPCCGVFEMEQGRIKVWRDYFDMGTYLRLLRP